MVVPIFTWWLPSQHSPWSSSSWPASAHDKRFRLNNRFLYGTSEVRRGELKPNIPTRWKVPCLTEEGYEIQLKVDSFGEYMQTFKSLIIFWLHKHFQIIVQYWAQTKMATVVEIAWFSLFTMYFWLTYWCSSFNRCFAAETDWSFPDSVQQNLFQMGYGHCQFYIHIPIEFPVQHLSGFVHIPTASYL